MSTYEIELVIENFYYEIDAESEEEAIEQAKLTMWDDIRHNPAATITDVKCIKR